MDDQTKAEKSRGQTYQLQASVGINREAGNGKSPNICSVICRSSGIGKDRYPHHSKHMPIRIIIEQPKLNLNIIKAFPARVISITSVPLTHLTK
jgi:hypothetical protein